MPMSPDDRKSFSLKIASADEEIANFTRAKAQVAGELLKLEKLDIANKNLFDPSNVLVNGYQVELNVLDGITRTTFTEQDIQDSAAFKIGNYFYPNNVGVSVPSLAATNNIWTKPKPFALGYGIGKNYSEGNATQTKEGDLIAAVQALIVIAGTYSPMERATGLELTSPTDLDPYPAVITLEADMVAAVTALRAFIAAEIPLITTADKDNTKQTQNNAAINNINTVILPALDLWLSYVDFNDSGVTAANWPTFDATTLEPTHLSVTQVNVLAAALTARLAFVATRISQIQTNLGTINQDVNTGEVTGSGYYLRRYNLLLLRLDLLNGSLSKYNSMKNAANAQDGIIASIKQNKATYMSVLPTSLLAAPGNDTEMVQLVDASLFSPGDTVYVMAEEQLELQRAIKSINGNVVVLNDPIPAKYKTTKKLRLYKDLT